ncbi:MAG TPA: heme-copper oxidase subunit III [Candidatus Binatia bacterium]|nr:heme-copper oxidase subunit III [Candidatus Binatia bacterium]
MTTLTVERPRRINGHRPPPPPPTGGGDGPEREPGPRRPLDNVRLAMLFLICGEVMFFGGLVSAFLVLRVTAAQWPPPLQPRLPVGVTGVNTLVLLASSVAMVAAIRALERDDARALVRRLLVTGGLGAAFLLVQGYEWVRLVGYGLTVSSGAYGSTFYTVIGTHAAHVVAAVVWVGVSALLAAGGRFADGRTGPVRACAIYWHFVVALWPILYVTVYLV